MEYTRKTIKASRAKVGMDFLGQVIKDSQSCGVDGIEIDDPSGVIRTIIRGGHTADSITLYIGKEDEIELNKDDKIAVDVPVKVRFNYELSPTSIKDIREAQKIYERQISGSNDLVPSVIIYSGGKVIGAIWITVFYHTFIKSNVTSAEVVVLRQFESLVDIKNIIASLLLQSDYRIVINPMTKPEKQIVEKLKMKQLADMCGYSIESNQHYCKRKK
jgi:hypothetical protein